ncbi:tRNA (adenosine(37)-N6)-threonylcarbamoyltransferase complex ATPase subunit type 1 TsaE [Oscillatoria salina]|uniref:tRNA (adenosine(37)-N6)-threonylcarbamoyltransferase complex ATPase subunit type 1 TsaE n=1 Tax=Oscillatoria salina TaxID=331517 RepID=UPI0013BA691D|nr:tRNA (adenosine(37)-N6)-threonylcarbamoyltransferase complex ATPase subunit type 1 TsaE [Oscillatoria salina]MBZ8180105.1 tRNA (adenosine(37)-N6)-threonylcarbamoyltransferase complex ATPase subunit type 1 TsaE [Oscillatoria salina IIICB1]NET89300.1 tRNA (adenosine(37)-N6)-threonylcarbamoyltransferase complex ATPase subunit type 1 TsaE [Kamptonema sp. SIO1D9]
MTQQQIYLLDAQATFNLGKRLGETLPPGSVILLEGDLGAGKTTLVQGIGAGLGITQVIVSPTFTLVNEYLDGRLPLYHLDLYRLSANEIEGIYPETYWEGSEVSPGITAIEWGQRLPYKPSAYLELQLSLSPQSGRIATLQLVGIGDRAFLPLISP